MILWSKFNSYRIGFYRQFSGKVLKVGDLIGKVAALGKKIGEYECFALFLQVAIILKILSFCAILLVPSKRNGRVNLSSLEEDLE